MIAVIGAGAMGAALGLHLSSSNPDTVLLATQWDSEVVDAWRAGDVHPALGLAHPSLRCRAYGDWDADLANAAVVVIAVATEGLRPVLEHAIAKAWTDASWVIATKGWQPDTLESPVRDGRVDPRRRRADRVARGAGTGTGDRRACPDDAGVRWA